MSHQIGDVKITAEDIRSIRDHIKNTGQPLFGEPTLTCAGRGLLESLPTVEPYEVPSMMEMLEKVSANSVPVPLKMWYNAADVKDLDALYADVKAEFQAAEKDPLGGRVQTRNELEKSLEITDEEASARVLWGRPNALSSPYGGVKAPSDGNIWARDTRYGWKAPEDADSMLTEKNVEALGLGINPNETYTFSSIAVGPSTDLGGGITITSSPAITASNLTLSDYQLPYLKDHRIEDLTVPLTAPYVEAKSTTRRVRVDMKAKYWAAFKGIAEALDGRHLRFQDTDVAMMAAEGYHSGKCMVLASDVKIQTYTIHEGARELSLLGLLVPVEFLD